MFKKIAIFSAKFVLPPVVTGVTGFITGRYLQKKIDARVASAMASRGADGKTIAAEIANPTKQAA